MHVHVVQHCAFFFLFEGQRSTVLWRLWPTASLSSSQPKLLRGAVTVTPLQTLQCLRISMFFCLHAQTDMRVFPIQRVNGSFTLDRSPQSAYRMLAALYVKLNLAVRQPSLAQQGRTFSHFSPSTAAFLAWKPNHSRTESTANDMFVSHSTRKRSSSRPIDKSTSCIMHDPNVYAWSQSVPIKLTDVPIELIGGLESALEHRNSAFTRSRRTFDPSLERSCSCAHVYSNYCPGQKKNR